MLLSGRGAGGEGFLNRLFELRTVMGRKQIKTNMGGLDLRTPYPSPREGEGNLHRLFVF